MNTSFKLPNALHVCAAACLLAAALTSANATDAITATAASKAAAMSKAAPSDNMKSGVNGTGPKQLPPDTSEATLHFGDEPPKKPPSQTGPAFLPHPKKGVQESRGAAGLAAIDLPPPTPCPTKDKSKKKTPTYPPCRNN